jgi:hypothetical protein
MDGDAGPSFCEHRALEWFDLTERDGSHSSSFEPKAEAANSAEEVEDIHVIPLLKSHFSAVVASAWMWSVSTRQRHQPVDDQSHQQTGAARRDENPD